MIPTFTFYFTANTISKQECRVGFATERRSCAWSKIRGTMFLLELLVALCTHAS